MHYLKVFKKFYQVKNDLRIINDDYVFSHLLDEVLSHDGDLLEFEPKLSRSSRPIMVIENDDALIDKWLRLELTHARERYGEKGGHHIFYQF